jgi:hypothetical protein
MAVGVGAAMTPIEDLPTCGIIGIWNATGVHAEAPQSSAIPTKPLAIRAPSSLPAVMCSMRRQRNQASQAVSIQNRMH